MLSPKLKRNIARIIPFGVIWFVFSLVYTLLEKGILADLRYYPSTGNPYNFRSTILITPLSALCTGLLVGTMEVLYINPLLIQKSFTKKIIYKSTLYLIIILSFVVVLSVIANAGELHTTIFDPQVWANVAAFTGNYAFLSVVIYIASIIIVSQFYIEVSDNMGQEVLANFFTGRYHKPTEEERIFMFLDMKSSTTIAERLGHVRYFRMLRAYFFDLTEPVIQYSGEVYQYVGDEIVISWKLENGLKNFNCLRCFFAMKEAIKKQSMNYEGEFGIVPEFKAGFHLGKVTTGEIGVIKKEIIFTGDVLNTTARIQELCNEYRVDLLISNRLVERMETAGVFNFRSFGQRELRGRGEKIELFTIQQ